MSDDVIIQLLTDIKVKLTEIDTHLTDLTGGLYSDRTWIWRILALTIIGAFALIGVKLVLPV